MLLRMKKALTCLGMLLCAFALVLPLKTEGAAYPPQKSTQGMVVSSHVLASAIGQDVLDNGGNAMDAAVAVGYALAVVHPVAGNIGGGGFAVIHTAKGEDITLDFREKAPFSATRDMYLDADGNVIPDASVLGYKAAGVPGTVAGMSALLERFGTKKLSDLIAPAIRLAEKGYQINARQEESLGEYAPQFAQFASSRKYFLKPDGSSYKQGDLFVQKDLAKMLRYISSKGPNAFYKGPIADILVADMQKNGGLITHEDLAAYQVRWRDPVKGTYRGYEIVSMAPPSSGGVHLIQMLNTMENAQIGAMGFNSSATIHLMAEAMRYAFADRSEYMGDPDFVVVPVAELTSKAYANKIYKKIMINKNKATPSSKVRPGMLLPEKANTTHYSVVDQWGNAVAVTYTINDSYGSATAVDGAGFLLNNEMDDFAAKAGVPNIYGLVGSDANSIIPEKRPLSSMTPTIVLRDGNLFMVVGSPGGSRIITTVLQVITNVIDHGMSISEAVEAPRFHMQWLPDELRTEKYGVCADVQKALERMGYKVTVQPNMGDVNAIVKDPQTGMLYGSGDPRAEF